MNAADDVSNEALSPTSDENPSLVVAGDYSFDKRGFLASKTPMRCAAMYTTGGISFRRDGIACALPAGKALLAPSGEDRALRRVAFARRHAVADTSQIQG